MRRIYLGVALGGALGAVARYLLSLGMLALAGPGFPWGTLLVNLLGSFLIGLGFELTEPDGRLFVSPAARQFFLAGFCGGFTTFSIFSFETLLFAISGETARAGLYVALSVLWWLAAVWAGAAVGRRINRLKGRSS